MDVFIKNPNQSFNYKQLSTRLGVNNDNTRRMITEVLYELVGEERLVELSRGKFRLQEQTSLATGILVMSKDGSGEVTTDDNREIFIPDFRLNHALHGDRVEISIYRHRRMGLLEGEVIRVIERAKRNFVGTISLLRNHAFVAPDNKLMPYDILFPMLNLGISKMAKRLLCKLPIGLPGKRTQMEK